MLSPLVLFTYNRPRHLKQTIESLLQNPLASESKIYIYSDGAKKEEELPLILEIRKYLSGLKGFKEINIIEREKNCGLAKNVISGVTEVLESFEKVIVLEDDLVFTPNFLKYMNEALDLYEKNPAIYSVTGFSIPIQIPKNYPHSVYLSLRPASWSWATWKTKWLQADWQLLDFELFMQNKKAIAEFNLGGDDLYPMLLKQYRGTIDSWAIRWAYTHYLKKTYCVYPTQSLVRNIGNDGSGTHVSKREENKYSVELKENNYQLVEELSLNDEILQNFRKFYQLSWHRKLRNRFLNR